MKPRRAIGAGASPLTDDGANQLYRALQFAKRAAFVFERELAGEHAGT